MENINKEAHKHTRKEILIGYWNGHLAALLAGEVNLLNLHRLVKIHGMDKIIGQQIQQVPGIPTPVARSISIKDQIKTEENNIKTIKDVMQVVEQLIDKEK